MLRLQKRMPDGVTYQQLAITYNSRGHGLLLCSNLWAAMKEVTAAKHHSIKIKTVRGVIYCPSFPLYELSRIHRPKRVMDVDPVISLWVGNPNSDAPYLTMEVNGPVRVVQTVELLRKEDTLTKPKARQLFWQLAGLSA